MIFSEATKLIDRKKGLIGTTTEKGLLIDLILIVPTDEHKKKEFVVRLLNTRDPQQSIAPYMNGDVEVWATNSVFLYNKGVLFYDILKD